MLKPSTGLPTKWFCVDSNLHFFCSEIEYVGIWDTTSCQVLITPSHHSAIAIQSGDGMSLWGLTAGRCHVVYSTGITAPNLPVMKTQLEKKKREIMIME